MIRIPLLSGREITKILAKFGYRVIRQRGSHIRLSCPNRKSVTMPDYKVVSRGLLRKIIRDAALTLAEFYRLLK